MDRFVIDCYFVDLCLFPRKEDSEQVDTLVAWKWDDAVSDDIHIIDFKE